MAELVKLLSYSASSSEECTNKDEVPFAGAGAAVPALSHAVHGDVHPGGPVPGLHRQVRPRVLDAHQARGIGSHSSQLGPSSLVSLFFASPDETVRIDFLGASVASAQSFLVRPMRRIRIDFPIETVDVVLLP